MLIYDLYLFFFSYFAMLLQLMVNRFTFVFILF